MEISKKNYKLKQTEKAKQYGALDRHLSKTNKNTLKEAGPNSEEYMELEEIVTKFQEPFVASIKTNQTDEEISNEDDEEIDVDFEMLQPNDTINRSKEHQNISPLKDRKM